LRQQPGYCNLGSRKSPLVAEGCLRKEAMPQMLLHPQLHQVVQAQSWKQSAAGDFHRPYRRSLSCFALVVGIVMTQNAAFQQKADFGYAINEVAVVQVNNAQEYRALSQAVQSNVEIKSVAGSAQQIGDDTYTLTARTKSGELQAQIAEVGGQEYLNTMGIRVVDGRQFHSGEADTDESILVNQTFVERSGLKQPLGQQVTLDSTNYTIIGLSMITKNLGDTILSHLAYFAWPDPRIIDMSSCGQIS
jgi:hypothetical protein